MGKKILVHLEIGVWKYVVLYKVGFTKWCILTVGFAFLECAPGLGPGAQFYICDIMWLSELLTDWWGGVKIIVIDRKGMKLYKANLIIIKLMEE